MKPGLTVRCAVVATLGAGALSSRAHADLRSFTHTYEYSTQPEGRTALQFWHTQTRATTHAGSPHLYEGLLEVEHGITEHLDVGFYTMFEEVSGEAMTADRLHVSRVEVEARYRFAERAELPIDSQVMLELLKHFGESIYEAEGRLIGARDFGDLTFAANIAAQVIGGKDVDETRVEVLWAAGATFQALPRLRVGVETWGMLADGTPYVDAGPALSFAASERFWTAASVGFAVNQRDAVISPAHGVLSARVILGIEL